MTYHISNMSVYIGHRHHAPKAFGTACVEAYGVKLRAVFLSRYITFVRRTSCR